MEIQCRGLSVLGLEKGIKLVKLLFLSIDIS